jgi:hypothetical protein
MYWVAREEWNGLINTKKHARDKAIQTINQDRDRDKLNPMNNYQEQQLEEQEHRAWQAGNSSGVILLKNGCRHEMTKLSKK